MPRSSRRTYSGVSVLGASVFVLRGELGGNILQRMPSANRLRLWLLYKGLVPVRQSPGGCFDLRTFAHFILDKFQLFWGCVKALNSAQVPRAIGGVAQLGPTLFRNGL